jgi:hypothetical protein
MPLLQLAGVTNSTALWLKAPPGGRQARVGPDVGTAATAGRSAERTAAQCCRLSAGGLADSVRNVR